MSQSDTARPSLRGQRSKPKIYKSKQFLFLAFLLLLPIFSKGQVPGYQGKKFFIEAGISFFPNLSAPSLEFKSSFSMKAYYSFSIHAVLGRKTIFKTAYTYQASGMIVSNYNYYDSWSDYYHLHLHDINFAVDIYGNRKGNLAPLGIYFSPAMRFVFTQGVYQKSSSSRFSSNSTHPSVVAFGLSGSIGYRTILANTFVLNFSFEMTLFPQYFMNSSLGNLDEYDASVIKTIADRYLFGFHVGIGVLF